MLVMAHLPYKKSESPRIERSPVKYPVRLSKALRAKLARTYPAAIATTALFVALGGSAYAAIKVALPRSSTAA